MEEQLSNRDRVMSAELEDSCDETEENVRLDLPVAPTVLIVDDDTLVLERLKEIVEADGYPVVTAQSGKEALDRLSRSSAAIVVTDLSMPEMDGLELCRRIRARPAKGYVYLFLLTVRDDEKDVLAGFEAGADDYLSKRSGAALFTARLRTAKRVLALECWLKDALEKKRQLVMSDPLTGAYNLRYLVRHVGRELKRSQRFGGHLSLLLLDIDHFKQINDRYGHAVGDFVLKKLTRQIALCLKRETDWCARLGGDEFAIVLEGAKTSEACAFAEKVRAAAEHMRIDTSAGPVHVTVSIGIAGLDADKEHAAVTVQSLLQSADANLYASKARGRNRVSADTPAKPVHKIEPLVPHARTAISPVRR